MYFESFIKANKQFTLQQLEIVGDQVNRVSDQIKRFSNVKTPEEFFHLQNECLQENLSATMTIVSKIFSAQTESGNNNFNKSERNNK